MRETTATTAIAGGRLVRRVLSALVVTVLLAGGFSVMNASPAHANLSSSRVKLQGNVSCAGYTGLVKSNFGKVRWVYVTGSNGERGFASRTGNMSSSKQSYTFQFNKIPSGKGINVTFEFGCGSTEAGQRKFKKEFGLNRPKVGGSQTRHVCAGSLVRCF